MGVSTIPPSTGGGGGVQRQVFTSSGTFTPPAGVTAVDVTCIGAGGGGGGGGGGVGSFYTHATNKFNINTGFGGGGGGGGEYVYRQAVPVTPGSPVTVTVGAGGTGGQRQSSATYIHNYIDNPSFEVNTTGWTTTGTSVTWSRFNFTTSTGLNSGYTNTTNAAWAYRAVASAASGYTLTYDSGTGVTFDSMATTDPDGMGITMAFTGSVTTQSSSGTVFTVKYYNGATLLLTTSVNAGSWSASTANAYMSNGTYVVAAPPASANRFTLEIAGTFSGAATFYFEHISFGPYASIAYAGQGSAYNFVSPDSTNVAGGQSAALQPFTWEGTANNSRTLANFGFGLGSTSGVSGTTSIQTFWGGTAGANGAKGGTSSFGSLVKAIGGGGGGGAYSTLQTNSFLYRPYSGATTSAFMRGAYSGGTGGYDGGTTSDTQYGYGGGGTGAGGYPWLNTPFNLNDDVSTATAYRLTNQTANGFNITGLRGLSGNYTHSSPAQSTYAGFFAVTNQPWFHVVGALGVNGTPVCSGGSGGGAGGMSIGNANTGTPQNDPVTDRGTGQRYDFVTFDALSGGTYHSLVSKGGVLSTLATGGVSANGADGSNGSAPGAGGSGGGGGSPGTVNALSAAISTLQKGGNGGNGGNGADGLVIVEWYA